MWEASATTNATLRAEPIALWCDTFLHPDALDAWWVEVNGRPVSALPLVRQRLGRVVPIRTFPTNPYLYYADPLLDESLADPAPVVERLLAEVFGCTAGPVFLWLEMAAYRRKPWPLVLEAAERMGLRTAVRHRHEVGRAILPDSWEEYLDFLDKQRRRKLDSHLRQLQRHYGPVHHQWVRPTTPMAVRQWVRLAFGIEALSWKHDAGTAVCQEPHVLGYFEHLGRLLWDEGHLGLHFLMAGDRPVAASYGFEAKGVGHLVKVGCDDSLRRYGPGQLLNYLTIRDHHTRPDMHEVNFFGELVDYLRPWANQSDPVGRVVIANRGLRGAGLFGCYEHLAPAMKRAIYRLRGRELP